MRPDPRDAPSGADIEVADVRERLRTYRATGVGARDGRGWQAATALTVAPGNDGPAIAFIRRSERPGDRWSGQMALPGGTRDAADPDLATTARREAHEEVGLVLGEHLTRLPDQGGRVTRGVVATFAFVLDHRPVLEPDPHEVAEALWIPLRHLFDPAATTRLRHAGVPFRGIEHQGQIIWGLTLRILESFAQATGLSLPR